MSSENGDKSKIIMFLLGILQTVMLAWILWSSASMVEAKTAIATLQANYANIMQELIDIKSMLRRK